MAQLLKRGESAVALTDFCKAARKKDESRRRSQGDSYYSAGDDSSRRGQGRSRRRSISLVRPAGNLGLESIREALRRKLAELEAFVLISLLEAQAQASGGQGRCSSVEPASGKLRGSEAFASELGSIPVGAAHELSSSIDESPVRVRGSFNSVKAASDFGSQQGVTIDEDQEQESAAEEQSKVDKSKSGTSGSEGPTTRDPESHQPVSSVRSSTPTVLGPKVQKGVRLVAGEESGVSRLHSSDRVGRNGTSSANVSRGGTLRRHNLMQHIVTEFDTLDGAGPGKRRRSCRSYLKDKSSVLYLVESIFSFFICINCALIGISADFAPSWHGWLILELIFCVFFGIEMVIKILLQRKDYYLGPDKWWNLFEACLVVFGCVDVGSAFYAQYAGKTGSSVGVAFLRCLRLVRITRLFRLCRMEIFTELMIMVQGALGGVRTLFWSTLLICLPLYAAAILFRETLGEAPEIQGGLHGAQGSVLFSTVPHSFFTLFRCIVTSECSDHNGRPIFALVAEAYGWGYSFVYCFLDMMMQFGLFNVIVAIFIENVLAAAKTNDLIMRRNRLQNKGFFTEKMVELVSVIWQVSRRFDGEDDTLPPLQVLALEASHLEVSPEVFEEVVKLPRVHEIFRDLNMAEEDLVNLFDLLDVNDDGLVDMAELFDGIAKLRGSPCRSDLVSLVFMLERLQEDVWDQRDLSNAMFKIIDQQAQAIGELTGITPEPPALEELSAEDDQAPSAVPFLRPRPRKGAAASERGSEASSRSSRSFAGDRVFRRSMGARI